MYMDIVTTIIHNQNIRKIKKEGFVIHISFQYAKYSVNNVISFILLIVMMIKVRSMKSGFFPDIIALKIFMKDFLWLKRVVF